MILFKMLMLDEIHMADNIRSFFRKAQAYRRRLKTWVGAYFRFLLHKLKYQNPGKPARELLLDIYSIGMSIDDRGLSKKNGAYKKIYRSMNAIVDDSFLKHAVSIQDADNKLEGFYERFQLGLPWEDTVLFKGYAHELEKGNKVQGCYSMERVVALYEKKYDVMYEYIKKDGIKSSLGNIGISPICVYIGEDGNFIYTSGGNHRLNLAKVAGIKRIPVLVKARHVRWQNIRDELRILGETEFKEKYPSFDNHPDLF